MARCVMDAVLSALAAKVLVQLFPCLTCRQHENKEVILDHCMTSLSMVHVHTFLRERPNTYFRLLCHLTGASDSYGERVYLGKDRLKDMWYSGKLHSHKVAVGS